MDKIKQNKNYCSLDTVVSRRNSRAWFQNGKACFAWTLVMLFILALFPVLPVSASFDSSDFVNQPFPVVSSVPNASDVVSNGLLITSSDLRDVYVVADSDAYAFYYTGNHSVVYVSSISDSHVYQSAVSLSDSSNITFSTYSLTSSASSLPYELFYSYGWSNTPVSSILPTFTSLDAGLAAVRDYIDNGGGSSDELHDITFTLPVNNIAIVDLGTSSETYDWRVTATFPFYSGLFDNQFNAKVYFQYSNTIPTLNSQSGFLSQSERFAETGATNWLGQTKTGFAGRNNVTRSTRYLIIQNPPLENISASDPGETPNNGVPYVVSVKQAVSVQFAGLNAVLTKPDGSTSWDWQFQYNQEPYNGVLDENGNVVGYVDNDGNPVVGPQAGGLNDPWEGITTVTGWLQNIAEQIGSFFTGAISAIQVLISSGTQFFQSLGGLYAWLPAPVYSVLISALIVAITIGVIKVFL